MQRLLGFTLGFLLSLAAAWPAVADGQDESDTELRIMRWSPRDSAGNCFGEPRMPLCAVETCEACLIWDRPSLCEAVGRPGVREAQPRRAQPGQTTFFAYRIYGQRILYPEDIPAARAEGPNAWRPGDIALLAQWQISGGRPPSTTLLKLQIRGRAILRCGTRSLVAQK